MQNERKRILTMVENGTITIEEALTLLEAMEKNSNGASAKVDNSSDTSYKEPTYEGRVEEEPKSAKRDESMDDFLNDLRKDVGHVGERFMQFMQTAVQRVKTFDFDAPFGSGSTFTHSVIKPVDDLKEIIVDIDNGKLTIQVNEDTENNEVVADFTVKVFNQKTEEEAKEEFLKKLVFMNDEGRLRLVSDLKLTQVNVILTVPKKDYEKLSIRLLNGETVLNDLATEKLYCKTANGKIEGSHLVFGEAQLETGNGKIQLKEVTGQELDAETMNGRVYVSGAIKDVEAKSLNGHVVVTTTDNDARKVEARTVSGSVEIYVPSDVPLTGEISTNMGRLDLQLHDVHRTRVEEQFLQRSIGFHKNSEEERTPLFINGEAKTGSVIVCYNVK
ncbi:DUF4097 family beta strand repeat-containing protein [Sporosarcina cyprini]|uniref:DUF4097 family beta strand repeat-containing protein n=1 Tax=Sporosarcina cyprini TaxID=2910523 RepID=UPI001EE04FD9|nr:DUF4097 family beta strand repeat-containing protein [Sporosarcina cyprini]MCG3088659.1 DUF4097 family beta strand repeat-containing protein [Sporosarcina cyprini]